MAAISLPNFGQAFVLVPAGTVVTASGASAGIEVDNRNQFVGQLDVTAASGTTPSLTVAVQTSADNGVTDPWRTVASFPAATAVSTSARQNFVGLDRWIRASYTVTGTTPSETISVTGEIR